MICKRFDSTGAYLSWEACPTPLVPLSSRAQLGPPSPFYRTREAGLLIKWQGQALFSQEGLSEPPSVHVQGAGAWFCQRHALMCPHNCFQSPSSLHDLTCFHAQYCPILASAWTPGQQMLQSSHVVGVSDPLSVRPGCPPQTRSSKLHMAADASGVGSEASPCLHLTYSDIINCSMSYYFMYL